MQQSAYFCAVHCRLQQSTMELCCNCKERPTKKKCIKYTACKLWSASTVYRLSSKVFIEQTYSNNSNDNALCKFKSATVKTLNFSKSCMHNYGANIDYIVQPVNCAACRKFIIKSLTNILYMTPCILHNIWPNISVEFNVTLTQAISNCKYDFWTDYGPVRLFTRQMPS